MGELEKVFLMSEPTGEELVSLKYERDVCEAARKSMSMSCRRIDTKDIDSFYERKPTRPLSIGTKAHSFIIADVHMQTRQPFTSVRLVRS